MLCFYGLQVLKFMNEEGSSPKMAQDTNSWFVMDFLQNTSVTDGGEALLLGMKNMVCALFLLCVRKFKHHAIM